MSLILSDMQASKGRPRDATQQQLAKLREQLNQSLYLFSTAIMGFDLLEPAFHGDLCRYIELWGSPNYRRVITQMPRGSFKSSIGTQGNALWQICRQPDQPVCIINETEDKPKRWLRGIRHVVEASELFHMVYRDLIPQGVAKDDKRSTPQGVSWNDNCLDFQGRRPADPENSISGFGIGNALTGHHWPKMIMDDLVSVKHQQSPAEMQRVKEWALTHTKLMRPTDSGMSYVNCTPWTIDDVYVDFTQLYGYALYRRHALEGPEGQPDLDGEPVLSFFDKKTLLESAHKSRDAMATWYSQMMCIPLPGGEQSLHPSWLRWYTVEDDYIYIDPGSYVPSDAPQCIHLSKLHKAIFFDPAAAESAERKQSPGSRHGIVVVGIDAWGRKFILETIAMRDSPQRTIDTIFNAARNWGAGVIFIETVNAQVLWKHWILEKQQPGREWSHVRLTVREVLPGRADKNKRILDKAVEFETGKVFLNRVGCSEFQREYLEWHPNAANRDCLDAYSYSHHLLRPASEAEEQSWRQDRRVYDTGRDEITGYLWPFFLAATSFMSSMAC